MNEKQEIFTDFMEEFIKLDVDQKQDEIIEKEKILLAYLSKHALEHGINFELLKSREVTDIDLSNATYDDYLEAMMVYLQNMEEIIGLIINN